MIRPFFVVLIGLVGLLAVPGRAETITVFDGVVLAFEEGAVEPTNRGPYVVRGEGVVIDRTLALPALPENFRDTRRITAEIEVLPILQDGVPADPWTRLGWLALTDPVPAGTTPAPDAPAPQQTELVRFVTPFGGPAVFRQDLTALAPLLAGSRTLTIFLATYSTSPGWKVTVRLRYESQGTGQRRPIFARPIGFEPHVTTTANVVSDIVVIPEGTSQPRLRVLTTGHASDGKAQHEFVSCTHILRVDGREVASWRPWSEAGADLRSMNPMAGRVVRDGRELRASDFDRTGWHPGRVVEPTMIPLPELTPGKHRITLEIVGIRPEDPMTSDGKNHHGYWVVSMIVVADERWPE